MNGFFQDHHRKSPKASRHSKDDRHRKHEERHRSRRLKNNFKIFVLNEIF